MSWHQIPFVRILIPFSSGLIAFDLIGAFLQVQYCYLLIASGFIGLVILERLRLKHPAKIALRAFILNLLFFFLGGICQFKMAPPKISTAYLDQQHILMARIVDQPQFKSNSIQFNADLLKIIREGDSITLPIKLKCLLELDSNHKSIAKGDLFIARSQIKLIPPPLNPHGFNLKKYYAQKGVYHNTYIKSNEFNVLEKGKKTFIDFEKVQKELLHRLDLMLKGIHEIALAKAMLLGYKQSLDVQLKNAYVESGSMHVLAVSGLHLGILALLISFLLQKTLPSTKKAKKISAFIELMVIWIYTFLTGASASIIRSALMFSILILSKFSNRRSSIYNRIAAAAFMMLLIHPQYIYDIGFQLSFSALLGIVYFYPILFGILETKNRMTKFFYASLCLSLAAQLGTTPIALFYFNQFPVYFWLSGLVISLLAPLIMTSGLLSLIVWKIPIISSPFVFVFQMALTSLNSLVFGIQKMPLHLIDGIHISILVVILIYILIFSVSYSLRNRNIKGLSISLLILCIFSIMWVYNDWKSQHQAILCIYAQPKKSLISFINGQEAFTFYSHHFSDKELNYILKDHHENLHVKQNHFYNLEDSLEQESVFYSKGFFKFKSIKLAIFDEKYIHSNSKQPMDVDFVLLHNCSKLKDLKKVDDLFISEKILLDLSNPFYAVKKWRDQQINNEVHDFYRSGAFIKKLNQF